MLLILGHSRNHLVLSSYNRLGCPVSTVPVPHALVCGRWESECLPRPEKWLLRPKHSSPEQDWCTWLEYELRPPDGLESQWPLVVLELVPQAHLQLERAPELGQWVDMQALP